jgi:hypothetical protein
LLRLIAKLATIFCSSFQWEVFCFTLEFGLAHHLVCPSSMWQNWCYRSLSLALKRVWSFWSHSWDPSHKRWVNMSGCGWVTDHMELVKQSFSGEGIPDQLVSSQLTSWHEQAEPRDQPGMAQRTSHQPAVCKLANADCFQELSFVVVCNEK